MKTSELHQLIGKPAFQIGDRVKVKETGLIAWVSAVIIDLNYRYVLVDENDIHVRRDDGRWTAVFGYEIELA